MDQSSRSHSLNWRLQRLDHVESTNDIAAKLPAWHAVSARTQSKGRGRYRRSWVSDVGGIWLSAALPTPGTPETWAILPLAAGWALREALRSLGVADTRLRWPNDLMVGKAKLAGILVERFSAETAIIGVGINHTNNPAAEAPELTGLVVRLADLLSPLPPQEEVIARLLAYFSEAHSIIAEGRVAEFLPSLNQAWHIERVSIELRSSPTPLLGAFKGVDQAGNLLIADDQGRNHTLSPLEVTLLREIWNDAAP